MSLLRAVVADVAVLFGEGWGTIRGDTRVGTGCVTLGIEEDERTLTRFDARQIS